MHQGLGEHGSGRGAIACDVVGLLRDFLDQFGADTLIRLLKIDFLGDGDAIVGDGRSAIGLVEHDIAALRTERDLDGVSELVETREHSLASFLVVCNDLCHCSSTYGYTVWSSTRCPKYADRQLPVITLGFRVLIGRLALSALECQHRPRYCAVGMKSVSITTSGRTHAHGNHPTVTHHRASPSTERLLRFCRR